MTHPSAARLATMAAMAKPLSNPVNPEKADAAAGRGTGAGAALAVVAGAAFAGAAATATAAGAADAGLGAAGAAATATGAAAALEGGGAPGAKVGNLMVGAEVGLGGKLMRTVSFLGWTFEASAGLGGKAPPGVGMLSAISFLLLLQPKVAVRQCQTRILISQSLISC
jgi:nucleoid-associated protein YgaU